MPLTAEQSYALGTREGRDRINQQLRSNPQYISFLRSIGVNTNGPLRLSDQQRQQATAWVRQRMGSIGGLEIDPAGNLNNRHGFAEELKQWGPVAAAGAGIAAPFVLPALGIGGGGSAAAAGPGGLIPNSGGALTAGLSGAAPSVASQGVSAGPAALGTARVVDSANAASRAAGAGGGLKEFFTDPSNLAGLGAVVGGLFNGNGGGQDDAEELRRIQAITEAQMRRADPLHQAAVQLAFGRMPTNYRQGVTMNPVRLPE
jgi:hypothetical protein